MPDCHSFSPVITAECKVLILGSMPGVQSLERQQYYAHPRNRFWTVMTALAEEKTVPALYEDRLQMLLKQKIALWDVLSYCQREGSLDTAIQKEEANDFPWLFSTYPKIHTVCFNGGKAFSAFQKHQKALLTNPALRFLPLPSTSPANARWTNEKLLEAWRIIQQ